MDAADLTLARRLEEAALNSWPAPQQQLFDGWVLRWAGGYTRRANSATPLYPGQLSVASKVAHCEALYRARGLRPIFRLTSAVPDDALEALLAARGYHSADLTEVLYLPLDRLALPETGPTDARLRSFEEWLPQFVRLAGASAASLEPHRAILEAIGGPHAALVLSDGGTAVACGLAVLDHACCGLFDIVTAADRRRRGYGRQLVGALLRWGREHGAAHFYLQVMTSNTVARQLYARFGFETLYTYRYWIPPS